MSLSSSQMWYQISIPEKEHSKQKKKSPCLQIFFSDVKTQTRAMNMLGNRSTTEIHSRLLIHLFVCLLYFETGFV